MLDHLSASTLSLWFTCPLRVWMKEHHGPQRPSGAMFAGSCAHHAVEANFTNKIDKGEHLPAKEFCGVFEDAFDANVTKDKRPDWKGEDRQAIRTAFLGSGTTSSRYGKTDARRGLLPHFHRTTAPLYDPVAVEERFTMALPDLDQKGMNFPVVGFIDFRGSKGGVDRITDWKFRKRAANQREAETSEQLTTYQMLLKANKIKPPKTVEIVNCTYGGKYPNVDGLHHTRTAASHGRLKTIYQRVWRQLRLLGDNPENYPHTSPSSTWACSSSWCGWWKMCPYGGGGDFRRKKLKRKRS